MTRTCPHTGELLRQCAPPLENFYLGPSTGVVYCSDAKADSYSDTYFTDEYKNQYGKTYIEDEENLRSFARSRLNYISNYLPPPASLLEIGCACGFFLDEARKIGYDVYGIEISEYASGFANINLKLNVLRSSFDSQGIAELQKRFRIKYDIIAAFYALEHFPDQKLAFRNIASLANNGGIFTGALPSTFGPVFRSHPE